MRERVRGWRGNFTREGGEERKKEAGAIGEAGEAGGRKREEKGAARNNTGVGGRGEVFLGILLPINTQTRETYNLKRAETWAIKVTHSLSNSPFM